MNKEEIDKMFYRIELDRANDSCGFEFADGFSCTFDNIATCYDDRLNLYELVKQLQQENEKLKEKNTIYKSTIKGQYNKIEELKNAKRISKEVHKKRNKKLQDENEKLNHYKLLYQKVKERNDKAIEYIDNCLDNEYQLEPDYAPNEYVVNILSKTWDILEDNNEVSNEDN